jgi:hypothetical protein
MTSTARLATLIASALLTGALAACADLSVKRVPAGDDGPIEGVRYYLPKPFIVFAPNADGTVSPSVVYLPDKSHEYAIDTQSTLSSYSFQAATDPIGLLTTVQYATDTTAVASQAIASAGTGAAQVLNYESARAMAVQTQVNTAQTGVIAAQSAYSAALAALNSDTQANIATPGTVTAAALQTDASTVAQKQAALQVAQSALQAAQTTPQVVAASAAAGTPITTTAAAGTPVTASTWASGLPLSLPDRFGPIWYQIDDNGKTPPALVAVKAVIPDTIHKVPAGQPEPNPPQLDPKDPQPAFDTTLSALGPPQITVPATPFTLASMLPAVYLFNRDVSDVTFVFTELDGKTHVTKAVPVWDGKRTISLDLSQLKAGGYWLNVTFHYPLDPAKAKVTTAGFQKVLVSVTPK